MLNMLGAISDHIYDADGLSMCYLNRKKDFGDESDHTEFTLSSLPSPLSPLPSPFCPLLPLPLFAYLP